MLQMSDVWLEKRIQRLAKLAIVGMTQILVDTYAHKILASLGVNLYHFLDFYITFCSYFVSFYIYKNIIRTIFIF